MHAVRGRIRTDMRMDIGSRTKCPDIARYCIDDLFSR
jgi:hypothetical protein